MWFLGDGIDGWMARTEKPWCAVIYTLFTFMVFSIELDVYLQVGLVQSNVISTPHFPLGISNRMGK